jgi:hypothetical protein
MGEFIKMNKKFIKIVISDFLKFFVKHIQNISIILLISVILFCVVGAFCAGVPKVLLLCGYGMLFSLSLLVISLIILAYQSAKDPIIDFYCACGQYLTETYQKSKED